MGLFDNFKKAEIRSLENPNAPMSAENFLHIMGWGDGHGNKGSTNLGVTAKVWAEWTDKPAPIEVMKQLT